VTRHITWVKETVENHGPKLHKPKTGHQIELESLELRMDARGGRRNKLVVRATDGNGKLQISEYREQVPDGATGLHRVRAFVQKG
jgi:hypothetical protein